MVYNLVTYKHHIHDARRMKCIRCIKQNGETDREHKGTRQSRVAHDMEVRIQSKATLHIFASLCRLCKSDRGGALQKTRFISCALEQALALLGRRFLHLSIYKGGPDTVADMRQVRALASAQRLWQLLCCCKHHMGSWTVASLLVTLRWPPPCSSCCAEAGRTGVLLGSAWDSFQMVRISLVTTR